MEVFDYIFLITDDFTGYPQAYPTSNKTEKSAANHLYNNFILRFGNGLFQQLKNFPWIDNLCTTLYYMQTNGLTEHINQTVLAMFRAIPEKFKSS